MENPWLELELDRSGPPYLLERDRGDVEQHNKSARPEHKIMLNSIPEPFIGNPDTAKLVLLNLNPGHEKTDEEDHRRPEIKEAMLRNLHRESQEYPFYPFSPEFEGTGVAKWWRKHARELREEDGLNIQTIANRLFVIEWFPYHSTRSGLRKERRCESQNYSFQLAKRMLKEQGAIMVGMRSKEFWVNFDRTFEQVPFLNSPQNPCISRRNMEPGLFDRIVNALKA